VDEVNILILHVSHDTSDNSTFVRAEKGWVAHHVDGIGENPLFHEVRIRGSYGSNKGSIDCRGVDVGDDAWVSDLEGHRVRLDAVRVTEAKQDACLDLDLPISDLAQVCHLSLDGKLAQLIN
jgi:hypothetical protein